MVVAFIAPVGGGYGAAPGAPSGPSERQAALQLVARLAANREQRRAKLAAEQAAKLAAEQAAKLAAEQAAKLAAEQAQQKK
jgi:hypothetical protein